MNVIATVTGTLQILKAAIDARDQAKLTDTYKVLNKEVIEIQSTCVNLLVEKNSLVDESYSLKGEIRTLKNKIIEIEKKIDELAQYKLHEITPGSFVYRFEPINGEIKETHYLCQSCMDIRQDKSILRIVDAPYSGFQSYCPSCKETIYLSGWKSKQPPVNSNDL